MATEIDICVPKSTIFSVTSLHKALQRPLVKFTKKDDRYEDLDGSSDTPNPSASYNEEENTEGKPVITYTVDQAVDMIGFGMFQFKLSLITGMCWMADSMEMMILSILTTALHCEWQLAPFQQALTTTIVFCGMMMSSSFWGLVADKYGRRTEILFCSLFTFYYGVLSSVSPIFIWLLILRGLVGFGIGGAPQVVTLYAEFLPSNVRAKCVVFLEVFWAIGACFEALLALIVMPTLGWRWLLLFSSAPLVIFSLFCAWLPESARYDITRGRPENALATLTRIAKANGRPLPVGKLDTTVVEEHCKRGQLSDLFSPEYRRTTLILWFIWFCCALSYYGIVLVTTELFEVGSACHGTDSKDKGDYTCSMDCKMLDSKDYADLVYTSLAEFPGLLITAIIIERIGRKKTIALEFVAYSLFVLFLNICTTRTVLTVFLFVARAFISGVFQAVYVYTPEVYPTSVRALGLGSCSGVARCGAIITPFIAQVLLKTSSHLAISIYGVITLFGAAAALMLPIETKGREMKDTVEKGKVNAGEDSKQR